VSPHPRPSEAPLPIPFQCPLVPPWSPARAFTATLSCGLVAVHLDLGLIAGPNPTVLGFVAAPYRRAYSRDRYSSRRQPTPDWSRGVARGRRRHAIGAVRSVSHLTFGSPRLHYDGGR
jgi:hypothetical protein